MAFVSKDARAEAARMVSQSGILDDVAREILRKLQAEALNHKDTGDYMKTLKIERTAKGRNDVYDVWVLTDDPASYHIEVGHYSPYRGAKKAVWVEGLRIVEKTLKSVDGDWIEGGYK